MRQSKLFSKTRREAPKDEESKNAKLLIRAGFIDKEMAGVYTYLPLGLRVVKKIERIIRDEMNSLGAQEIELSALQDKDIWKKTDRWDDEKIDVWFKTKLKNDTEVGLGLTHEEPLINLMKNHINSYKDLPVYAYQFQTKFRNELRAKSGLMRGREFLMKDLYSFSLNNTQHEEFYDQMKEAYSRIFERVGIGNITFLTFASGGAFSDFSHEFQALSEAGEDIIYLDQKKGIAINEEVMGENTISKLGLNKDELVKKKSIEVGNIFSLGTRFSEALELNITDAEGRNIPVVMGSYGIGIGRLMGTVVEVLSDENGMVWPRSISPFDVHIIRAGDDEEVMQMSEKIYQELRELDKEVLFDDRDVSVGEKFKDSDLIGIPYQIIVGKRGIEDSVFEVKDRATGEVSKLSYSDIVSGSFLHD